MKILLINTIYATGSTGKICAHLYENAKKSGHIPYIGYGRNFCPNVPNSYLIGNKFDFFSHVLSNFLRGNSGFASSRVTVKFLKWVDTIQPDIIHLHNIHGFYINIPLLFNYIKSKNIPVVWTLHDCWALTGQCAYFDFIHCNKWKTQCQHCPQFRNAYPYSLFKDNSFHNYINKRNAFLGVSNLTIVTPSYWLANIVTQSYLSIYPTTVIPNGIDLSIFSISKNHSSSSQYILGVANIWDHRKGLSFFIELAGLLDETLSIILIGVTASQKNNIEKRTNHKIECITRTSNQKELAGYYSNALAFVNPTLEDTFPTTNLEALACGTPVITFNTGGSPEAISDDCGIVVKEKTSMALFHAIMSLKDNTQISPASCRQKALKYGKDDKYNQYIKLYESIIQKTQP